MVLLGACCITKNEEEKDFVTTLVQLEDKIELVL
jgi:hypothetical protein